MKDTCGKCRHFEKTSGFNGRCHAHAPVALEKGKYGEFPVVKAMDWCGEFKVGKA